MSSATADANGNATLNLTLTSPAGSEPAGLQWTLGYSPADVVSIGAIAGAASTAAGTSLTCAASLGYYTCVQAGLTGAVIQNGVVAVVNATLASRIATTAIVVTNVLGANAAANSLPISSVGGAITAVALLTVQTSPEGLQISLDGGAAMTAPQTFNLVTRFAFHRGSDGASGDSRDAICLHRLE